MKQQSPLPIKGAGFLVFKFPREASEGLRTLRRQSKTAAMHISFSMVR